MRYQLAAAIDRYEQVIGELSAHDPGFPAHALGAGFTDSGQALAARMRDVHALSLEFLRTRVQGWHELIRLMDSVEETDKGNAAQWGPQ